MTWRFDLLVQGYPGTSLHNGSLGWSSVALARGHGRVVVFDGGAFGLRRTLAARLSEAGVALDQVTDLVLSHLHYDHCENWTLFPNARVHACGEELAWALSLPDSDLLVPVPVVRALAGSGRVVPFDAGAAPLPGIASIPTPGHSPHHVAFLLEAWPRPVIFAADAAKNLAELLSGEADLTMDAAASRAGIAALRTLWDARPDALLVPGHDLPLERDAAGAIRRVGARRAGIEALLGEAPGARTRFGLDGGGRAA